MDHGDFVVVKNIEQGYKKKAIGAYAEIGAPIAAPAGRAARIGG